jgi:S1-C subfamily serine protease
MKYIFASSISFIAVLGLLLGQRHPVSDSGVRLPVYPARYVANTGLADFTAVARAAVPATVHVIAHIQDGWGEPGWSSGSGAILSEDGYIVTNNHVVKGGEGITVTVSNHRTFKAKIIGVDAAADIAVLKIDGRSLPYFSYGNSEELKIGQWVLAVGYPLSLETTVTAGIVSAKRGSLIQTDAAVNLGNSGGPLIDREGRLVGIVAALTTSTGSYVGYSFAFPSDSVKRVVNRLLGAVGAVVTH